MIGFDLDIARPRVTRTVEAICAEGLDWETGSNVLVDPVAHCLMLRPYQAAPEWDTTFTGLYLRKAISDFETAGGVSLDTLTNEWTVNQAKGGGDHYLENLGVNYSVFLKDTLPINRPMFLEWYVPYGRGKGETSMECGWGTPGAGDYVSLRVRTNGNCEVWKGANRVGVYSISKLESTLRNYKAGDTVLDGPTGSITAKMVTLFLVPILPRMLLVFSSNGGGFVHAFGDLPQADPTNIITPAGKFGWRVAQGKASVQCCPLTFPTSGYALRRIDSFLTAPPVDTTFVYTVRGSYAGYGTSQTAIASIAGTTGLPFVPNGSLTDVRLRLDITGDATNTPYVFSAAGQMDRAYAYTSDAEQTDIADHIQSLTLSVGRDSNKATGSIVVGDKDSLEVAGIQEQSNRPFRIRVSPPGEDLTDARTLLIGNTGNPSTQQRQTEVEASLPVTIPFTDLWAQIENTRYERDGVPLDGWPLTEAIQELLIHAGIPDTEWDIETSTLPIPFSWTLPLDYKYQPKAGDSVAKWLMQLHKDFAPTWYMGFYPTATGQKFRFKSRSGMGTTPKATIWLHRNAVAGRTAARDWKEEVCPPEATRITVYGFDPGTRTFLRAGWLDSTLEDPSPDPSDRPTGWRGQRDPLCIVDERLTTADAVLKVRDEMVDRVATVLYSAQWKSDLLCTTGGVPLWIGDVVRVKKQDGSVHGDYRIESMSLTLKKEAWRDCQYAGTRLGEDE